MASTTGRHTHQSFHGPPSAYTSFWHSSTAGRLGSSASADFVGNRNRATADVDPSTAKSRTAFIIWYAGCPVTWASKLQTEVALSSTESECNALSKSLLRHLHDAAHRRGQRTWVENVCGKPTVHCKVFQDNSGAPKMVQLPKMRPRTKHICIKMHHFREHVCTGKISIQHIPSKLQLAGIATKPQPEALFADQRDRIMNWKAKHTTSNKLAALACYEMVEVLPVELRPLD
jgi:hypothetical protein